MTVLFPEMPAPLETPLDVMEFCYPGKLWHQQRLTHSLAIAEQLSAVWLKC